MTDTRPLYQALNLYEETWLHRPFYRDASTAGQYECLQKFFDLLANSPDPFSRDNRPGHITASAFVIDPDLRHVLLTLHKKLNIWLQLGGHADEGQTDVSHIALREVHEESGLTELQFFDTGFLFPQTDMSAPVPFDIDVHRIPSVGTDTAHDHYDISFILAASTTATLCISDESHDLKWFLWEEAHAFCDPSIGRALTKLQAIRAAMHDSARETRQ